jgi:hypothetical protein
LKHAVLMIAALSLLAAGAQAAPSGPRLPCDPATAAFPPEHAPPAIDIWHGDGLDKRNWRPPACTGWPAESRAKLIVTLAASFRYSGSMDGLLARVGAISTLRDIRYWSARDGKWGPLANDASALTSADAKSRRADFAPGELAKGADLHYWEDDTRTGATVYRMRVLESSAERAVISSDNVTPVRRYLMTIFKPGALQSLLIIQRQAPGLYGAYIVSRSGEGTSMLAAGHDDSYVSRASALYRALAGIKTDQEPPATVPPPR